MNHVEMKRRIQQFIESWGEELPPEERAPAPLTNWLISQEEEADG